MSPLVCRTCLTVLKENSCDFFTLENCVVGMTTFREKLSCCIPELALDIIPNAVICRNCSKTLNLAYSFKTKCLETESKVQECIKHMNNSSSTEILVKPDICKKNSTNLSPCRLIKLEPEPYYSENERVEINTVISNMNNNYSLKDNKGTELKGNCKIDKIPHIKLEDELNDDYKLAVADRLDDKILEQQKYSNYRSTGLQQLRENNISLSVCRQAFEQFNVLKAMQTLASHGTEISSQNKLFNESTSQNVMKYISHYEDFQNSPLPKTEVQNRNDCYYCDRSFDRLSLLKTHIISHTGVKPFTCNICGKGCSHRGELNNHLRVHTGEKPFKCSLCEASFSQISNMKIHMRTHTGEKPYKCNYCEKTFSHKCGMKVHLRTHTGERPYGCGVCLKTYTHKKDLDDHIRTHTGKKYKCTICSKEIAYKKNLSAHMITHGGKLAAKKTFRQVT